jgi:Phosphate-starvation-inducible E family
LFVLIIAEIVHTVVLSLRTHRLIAQPFLIVGLVAVIRRILALLGSSAPISTTEFAVLIAMVVVFIAGLIAVGRFGNGAEPAAVEDAATAGLPMEPDREDDAAMLRDKVRSARSSSGGPNM